MAIRQGTTYERTFRLKDVNDDPVNISGWDLIAHFRRPNDVSDKPPLLILSTDNGGFEIIEALEGRVRMTIDAEQSEDLPIGQVVFDVLRLDPDDGPVWLFGGRDKVIRPVTRDV